MRFLFEHLPPFEKPLQFYERTAELSSEPEATIRVRCRKWRMAGSITIAERRFPEFSSADSFTLWSGSISEATEKLVFQLDEETRSQVEYSHPQKASYRTGLLLLEDGSLQVESRTPWAWQTFPRTKQFVARLRELLRTLPAE